MFPGSITTPGGAFTPYPSAWAQFAADPANAQALQGYQQVMAMMQQAGGFMPFSYPGMTSPIMRPPMSTPSTFVPRMVPIRLVNLTGTMNEAAPSNVHEVDEAEQEAARRRKGKAIAKPSKTRDSAFKRLGDKEDGPRKSAKLRLGPEMGRTSAMERLGGNRSSVNVLYLDAFKKLKLDRSMLRPLQTPLSGFTGASIEAEGQITLPVTLGSGNKTVTKQMRFVVVDIKCVHNAILGRPGINQVRAIISMAHLCMKFYTPNGIGEERGDQKNARSCYLEAVKKMTRQFEQIELVSQQVDKGEEKARIELDANTEEIQIDASNPERKVKIGVDLQEELRTEVVQVLTRYKSLFAWSVADMPGIDRSVICHRLSVLEGSRPVRQKKRFLASDRRDFVKKEVKDLLEWDDECARAFEELKTYLTSNIVISKPETNGWCAAVTDEVGDSKLSDDHRLVVEDPIIAAICCDVVTAGGQPCDPGKGSQIKLEVHEIDAAANSVPVPAEIGVESPNVGGIEGGATAGDEGPQTRLLELIVKVVVTLLLRVWLG
ncbi:unnamed protein product [Cuscuta campestris]|uniref:Uncharacterized protein n=1 Tax=Cuscuta campestris TaxID=132261 RepID=A0A484K6T1_9ASTE|nr:unnamed protein product [Cuscuta campestris]